MNLSHYKEKKPNYLRRIVWECVRICVYSMIPLARHPLRNIILRLFGAELPNKTLIYRTVKIFAPWNLSIGLHSCIGPRVEIYNKGKVRTGDNVVIPQDAYLCTASHDISSECMSLVLKPIVIQDMAWIASHAIILPGVTVGEGAVVGAGSVVARDVPPWTVVAGNPAREIKKRVLRADGERD